jgi:hypothetical protein
MVRGDGRDPGSFLRLNVGLDTPVKMVCQWSARRTTNTGLTNGLAKEDITIMIGELRLARLVL